MTRRRPGAALAIAMSVALVAAMALSAAAWAAHAIRAGSPVLVAAAAWRHRTAPLPAAPGPVDCRLIVPADPLSARGLATPYQLSGPGCRMADANASAFVQATIVSPGGALSVYEPLVVDQGTRPAVAPVVPVLPKGAVVTIDFGFNGGNLTLVPSRGGRDGGGRDGRGRGRLWRGECVNGARRSVFGQVAYCDGPAFYRAADAAIAAGTLRVPAVGTGSDGQPCPTTRSFTLVDQDQSDNVTTTYLLTADGRTAQATAANAAALPGAATVANGSDNALLDDFVDPALGCVPFTAPDLANPGVNGTSQALDELQAAAWQQAPVALAPVNDPMTEVRGAFSLVKTNLYREGFGQPVLPRATDTAASAQTYCQNLMTLQVASLERDEAPFTAAPSADPAVGDNLFTFMAARLSGSFDRLGCADFGLANPVTLATDASGAAVGATFSPAPPATPAAGGAPAP